MQMGAWLEVKAQGPCEGKGSSGRNNSHKSRDVWRGWQRLHQGEPREKVAAVDSGSNTVALPPEVRSPVSVMGHLRSR